MRILLVTPECPFPILNGIRLRNFHLFNRLARSHHVSLLSFASEEELGRTPVLRDFFSEVHLVPAVYRRSLVHLVPAAIYPVPFFVKRMHSDQMARRVGQLISAGSYDVVHVSDLRMAHYLVPYTDQSKVVDACDCLSLLYRRAFFNDRKIRERLKHLQLWAKTRAYESRVYPAFDRCIVTSQVDADELRSSVPSLAYEIVPNGVDTEHFHQSPAQPEEGNSFVFVGVMDYLPNVDAARFFAARVMPIIANALPSASFWIVGRNPVREVLDLQNLGNVRVVKDVEDIRPYVWRCAVFVCPLRIGAGVKNKVLEAMAMAKPIVATSLACDGLQVNLGQDLLVADDPSDFAEKCIGLAGDKEARARLGTRARLTAEQTHSWQVGVAALERILTEVVHRRAQPALSPAERPDRW